MLDHNGVQDAVSVFLILITLIAASSVLATKLRVPASTLLVLVGIAVSLIPHFPRVSLDPSWVLIILLPPLLFSAAWKTTWRDFQTNLVPISILAIGLVAFTIIAVAGLVGKFIPGLDWNAGFVLGAVVATTDSVAAGSVARMMRLPLRVITILDGESLVNDATGLLGLQLGIILLSHHASISVGMAALNLLWLICGGVGAGLAIAVMMIWLDRLIDDSHVEMAMSLTVPYAAYLLAEKTHASGVLAVVACGIYCSRRSANTLSPAVRMHVIEGWSAIEFLLNSIVSLLIGLQFPSIWAGIASYNKLHLVGYCLALSLLLIVSRILWMFAGAPVARWISIHIVGQDTPPFSPRRIFLVGWTGMRGVVSLAAAFSLPTVLPNGQVFAQRSLIIFLTFSVILVTLVVQGLTLKTVIGWLKLGGEEDNQDVTTAKRCMLTTAIEYLKEVSPSLSEKSLPICTELLANYQLRLLAVDRNAPLEVDAKRESDFSRGNNTSLEIIKRQRHALIQLRDQGGIGDETLKAFEYQLDVTSLYYSVSCEG
jgi:Na+/H+ antiporter